MTQLAIIYHSSNPNCVLNMLHCIFKLNTDSPCKVEINQYIVINIIISLKRSSRCVRHRHRYILCSFLIQQDIGVVGGPEMQTVNTDILSNIKHRYIIIAHEIVSFMQSLHLFRVQQNYHSRKHYVLTSNWCLTIKQLPY